MQPQGHAQVIVNLVDFGMNLQEAGDAIRMHHTGSTRADGHGNDGRRRAPHRGWSARQRDRRAQAPRTQDGVEAVGQYGGYQAIWRDPTTGALRGRDREAQGRVRVGLVESPLDGIGLGRGRRLGFPKSHRVLVEAIMFEPAATLRNALLGIALSAVSAAPSQARVDGQRFQSQQPFFEGLLYRWRNRRRQRRHLRDPRRLRGCEGVGPHAYRSGLQPTTRRGRERCDRILQRVPGLGLDFRLQGFDLRSARVEPLRSDPACPPEG
mgnify:CR=1 FL=1